MNETMKLSEAIRLGAMMSPQAFGVLSKVRGFFRKQESTCALGAALLAYPCRTVITVSEAPTFGIRGEASKTHSVIQVPYQWAAILTSRVACPACEDLTVIGLMHRILAVHLNDQHKWTREAIADWVASIEDQILPRLAAESHTTECAPLTSK